ncbi:MAG: TetR/AcrR family transcriptional regulator [Ilumatobacteraceae bacterium]
MSKALVNYHFGGRDALITEAMLVGYERYVDELWSAAAGAGSDPVERLFAWINRQIEWTAENTGLAAALNFPDAAAGETLSTSDWVTERIQAAGERNFANLQTLGGAALVQLRTGTQATAPSRAEIGLNAALVGWVTFGLSIWRSGQHLPTRDMEATKYFDTARDYVRARVLDILRSA